MVFILPDVSDPLVVVFGSSSDVVPSLPEVSSPLVVVITGEGLGTVSVLTDETLLTVVLKIESSTEGLG